MYRSTTSVEKEKVLTKEELKRELEQYKKVLNKDSYDYLNSLLTFRNSVLCSEKIDEDFMSIMSKIDIYKKIANYNIYHRSLDVLKNEQEEADFRVEEEPHLSRINAYGIMNLSFRNISLFHYHFDHEGFHIGTFEMESNPTMRDLEIRRLEYLCESARAAGISHSRVEPYEESLEKLLHFTGLSEEEQKQAEIQNDIRTKIFEDYGICLEDFDSCESTSFGHLNQGYVKKFPGIEFVHNVRYY